jgi:hypothetical protein
MAGADRLGMQQAKAVGGDLRLPARGQAEAGNCGAGAGEQTAPREGLGWVHCHPVSSPADDGGTRCAARGFRLGIGGCEGFRARLFFVVRRARGVI